MCGGGGGGRERERERGDATAVKQVMNLNFCSLFNLISFTISNEA